MQYLWHSATKKNVITAFAIIYMLCVPLNTKE
nr:MAG TPA: hypothetical protein [Caudoviricetes sp.]